MYSDTEPNRTNSRVASPREPSAEENPTASSAPLRPEEAPTPEEPRAGKASRSKLLIGVAAAVLLVVILAMAFPGGGLETSDQLIFYTVERRDLAITVVERGSLESQDEVEIFCEVDDIEGDQIRGTPILSIVPNGASVEKGQLLVELDCSNHRERFDRQVLDTERARAEQIQAKVSYENQQTQNETLLAEAELKVKLAELALKQFEDEEGGTFQIDVQDLELQIKEAEAGQLIEQTNLEGIKELQKLGYRSSGDLAQARLEALQAERKLATALSRKKELVEYQYQKSRMELEGALASARRALEQVERDNEAALKQAKAAMDAADEAFTKEKERLDRYQEQIDNSKIYAPKAGMVAYATSRHHWYQEDVRVGAAIRPKQKIMTIPNLTKMQVATAVHESVLDQVRRGLGATIRVDAFRDRSFQGTVESVAVLASQEGLRAADTKVYDTIVTIDEDVENLKPGMTAVVEILVDRLEDVLAIPVQAVVQIGTDTWCYVDDGGDIERRTIALGATNDKFVEVHEGLEDGDRVVLNPMAIIDESESSETDAEREVFPRDEAPPSARPEPEEENGSPSVSEESGEKRRVSSDPRRAASREEGETTNVPRARNSGV